jgi:hypothetical protein
MNLTVHSDKAVEVHIFMTFTDLTIYEFKMRLEGHGPCQYTIVGRWPKDLVKMELQYNGNRFAHPIEVEGEHLKPIHVYGGRDKWSQLLRDRAWES